MIAHPTWSDRPTIIICGGPSVTREDVAVAVSRGANIVVVNEAWRLHPRAELLYAADPEWWRARAPSREQFAGERWTQDFNWREGEAEALGLRVIRSVIGAGVSTDPTFVFRGENSGFQAMGLAVLFGARRIVFLGLDLCASADGATHWHEEYPRQFRRPARAWRVFAASFEAAAPCLRELGVEVVNASRRTALACFPRVTIEAAL